MNKSKEVLEDLIHNYIAELYFYENELIKPQLDMFYTDNILSNMIEVAYKLLNAVDDLRKEIQNG